MLLGHKLDPRIVDGDASLAVFLVRDLDRGRLILDLLSIGSRNHRRAFESDLPLEQKPGRAMFFTSLCRALERVESQMESFFAKNMCVALVDRLELCRWLEAGMGQISFA